MTDIYLTISLSTHNGDDASELDTGSVSVCVGHAEFWVLQNFTRW